MGGDDGDGGGVVRGEHPPRRQRQVVVGAVAAEAAGALAAAVRGAVVWPLRVGAVQGAPGVAAVLDVVVALPRDARRAATLLL